MRVVVRVTLSNTHIEKSQALVSFFVRMEERDLYCCKVGVSEGEG
jgi:hypothetical protein